MSDTVELSIRQFVGAWDLMCTANSAHTRDSAPGVEYIFAGVPIPFFNVAILTGRGIAGDELRRLGRDVCGRAAPLGLPYLMIVTHEALKGGVDAAGELKPSGLVPMLPLTGMIAGSVRPPGPIPDGLRLTIPDDDAGCEAIIDVNSAAYGLPLDDARHLLGRAVFWRDKVAAVGVADGRAAATTAVFEVDGCSYVALVATEPGQQRKGYADAVMRFALDESKKRFGPRPTVLHATDAGRPVYERMGYAALASHTAFIEERFMENH